MRADQLRSSAETVAGLLKRSDVLTSIRQCRDAREENQHKAASSRLGQSAKIILQGMQSFSPAEQTVAAQLHLDRLASLDYWKALMSLKGDQAARQSELVQLYSRAMFASSHLPNLVGVLSGVTAGSATVSPGLNEGTMSIGLRDAGEKASDPDRIARSIDGVDMIYSACASLARKPAIDLQLLEISGHPDKTLKFLGDHDCVNAVYTVLESIPDAVAQFDPDEELDINELVDSLPVFDDLDTLDKLGTFSKADIRDIGDTMHQGVLLALESGVLLLQGPDAKDPGAAVTTLNKRAEPTANAAPDAQRAPGIATQSNQSRPAQAAPAQRQQSAGATPGNVVPMQTQANREQQRPAVIAGTQDPVAPAAVAPVADGSQRPVEPGSGPGTEVDDQDEYYQQYLEERERMRKKDSFSGLGGSKSTTGDRGNAMANLLKGLGRSKD